MSVAEAVQRTAKPQSSTTSGVLLQRKCAYGGSAGLTGECSDCRTKKLLGKPLQTKLRVNEPGDEYEREADRIAEQVMRMAAPEANHESTKTAKAPLVQRRVNGNGAGMGAAPAVVHEALSSPGQPLDAATRAFFEPRFGHDFGNVRVHADGKAAASARAVNAHAYTVGSHVVFGTGQHAAGGAQGRRLMAHELTHVVQQGKTPEPGCLILRQDAEADVDIDIDEPADVDVDEPVDVYESTDPHAAIREAIAVLKSVRFVEADRCYALEMEGASYKFNKRQYQDLRKKVTTALFGGINTLKLSESKLHNLYAGTIKVNEKYLKYWSFAKSGLSLTGLGLIAGAAQKGAEYFYGVEKPGEELTEEFVRARVNVKEADEAYKARDYVVALEHIATSEDALIAARRIVNEYRDALDLSGETIKQHSVIARNVSLGVLIGIGAVLATPVVAAGVSASVTGAGFTGLTGAGLTTLGTGTIVTGTGALAGGYAEAAVNVTEQALEGEGFDTQEFLAKTGGGVKLGSTAALSGSATVGVAGLLGEGTTLAGHAWRSGVSGYAGGASGSALGATLEGKSLWEIAKASQLGGLEGAIGGVFGGATSHLGKGRGVLARVTVETFGGGVSSGLGAAITGKSREEIAQSFVIGAITSGAVESGTPGVAGAKTTGSPAKKPSWEVVGQDVDYGIVILKAGDDYVGLHPDHPNSIFIPRGDQTPAVFNMGPDGKVTEGPWPFHEKRPAVASEVTTRDPAEVPQSEIEARKRLAEASPPPSSRSDIPITPREARIEADWVDAHPEVITPPPPHYEAKVGDHTIVEIPGLGCQRRSRKMMVPCPDAFNVAFSPSMDEWRSNVPLDLDLTVTGPRRETPLDALPRPVRQAALAGITPEGVVEPSTIGQFDPSSRLSAVQTGETLDADAQAGFVVEEARARIAKQQRELGRVRARLVSRMVQSHKVVQANIAIVRLSTKEPTDYVAQLTTKGVSKEHVDQLKTEIRTETQRDKIVNIVKDYVEELRNNGDLTTRITNLESDLARRRDKVAILSDPNSRAHLPPNLVPCFSGVTLVWTINGPIQIDQVKVGELVLSYDQKEGTIISQSVTEVYTNRTKHFYDITVAGTMIHSTGRHPFWVDEKNAWIEANSLKAGMQLKGMDGSTYPIETIQYRHGQEWLSYNLEVNETHTYFVGPAILVHNGNPVDLGIENEFVIYRGTNPKYPNAVYIGQVTQWEDGLKSQGERERVPRGIAVRQDEHRVEAANRLKWESVQSDRETKKFYDFKQGMVLEELVRGIHSPELASYLEQQNINIEKALGHDVKLLREQISGRQHRAQVESAIKSDLRLIAKFCPAS